MRTLLDSSFCDDQALNAISGFPNTQTGTPEVPVVRLETDFVLIIKTLRDGSRVYQTFQAELFVAKFLFKAVVLSPLHTEFIEGAIVDVAQVDG